MSVSPRSLETALKEAPSLRSLAGVADDVVIYGARALNQSTGAGSGVISSIPDPTDLAATRSLASGTAAVVHYANRHREEVGKVDGPFDSLDPLVGVAEKGINYAFMGDLAVNIAAPMLLAPAVGLVSTSAKNALLVPHKYFNPTQTEAQIEKGEHTLGTKINNGLMIGMSALSTYGVARSFSQQLNSLKHMYSDLTGVPIEKVSTMSLLTGKVPHIMSEARSHLVKEHLARGAAQIGGLAWMIAVMGKKKPGTFEQMGSMMLPGFADMGINALMGDSVLPVYTGFANAYKSGQPIPAQDYAAFILAADHDLAKRKVGKQVALEIGAEFANKKISPGEILREINDGRFEKRIHGLIEKDEAALAQKMALKAKAQHEAQAHKHEEKAHKHEAQTHKPVSMVDKISGAHKHERPTIGKFTKMVSEENKGLTPSIT